MRPAECIGMEIEMGKRKKVIIVGSGAGGAAAAFALAEDCDVTILEAGKEFKPFSAPLDILAGFRKSGLFFDERMIRLLIPNMQVRKSESMVMVNGIGTGGTTPLATGNAVRSDEALKKIGVDAECEFERLYEMLPVTAGHKKYWNPATRELFDIFGEMGLDPKPTPKFLHSPRCRNCGHCAIGCPSRVKWDARELLDEAVRKGAVLKTGCRVRRLKICGGEVEGLIATQGKQTKIYRADRYILAAGGFGTPAILEQSGIECEKTLFVDPVLCVAARRRGFGQDSQLLMPFYSRGDGYMLSPYIDYLSFFFDRRWRCKKEDLVSLMIKMSDDSNGSSGPEGIHKELTSSDRERLRHGVEQCREILGRMGIGREETFLGIVNAGHPGGMLPLTKKTRESLHDPRLPGNLYVADATLLPKSAGLPPILTIMALSLKVAEAVRQTLI